jgi:DNA polymerase-3 subunit delta'
MHTLPSGWHHVVGHDWAVRLLAGALAHNRAGHAYLFTGPDQIGKMTLARAFAAALNCQAEPGERPCGHCRACRLIAEDKHPDVRVILPEVSERGALSIKIDAIRRLSQDLSLSAYEGRYKIALLKRFDTANANAANAFLKTLEEPPANVVLLLTARESDALLPTITSRCRTVSLRPIPAALIEEVLMTRPYEVGHGVKPDEASLLARLADGRLGWAIRAHEQPALLQERAAQLEALHKALAGSLVARFAQAETLARKADALPALLRVWLSWWRDVALLAYDRRPDAPVSNIDQVEQIHALARQWPRPKVLAALRQTETALRQLDQNANARLVLENVLLAYPRPQ